MKMRLYNVYYVSELIKEGTIVGSSIFLFGSYSSISKLLKDLDSDLEVNIKVSTIFYYTISELNDFEDKSLIHTDTEQQREYHYLPRNTHKSFESFKQCFILINSYLNQEGFIPNQKEITIYSLYCTEVIKYRSIRYETLVYHGSSRSIKQINLKQKEIKISKSENIVHPKIKEDYHYDTIKLKINVPLNIYLCWYDSKNNNLVTCFPDIYGLTEEEHIDNMGTFLLRSIGKENIAIPTDIYKMIQGFLV